jgi:hypothetical protein
VQNRAQQLLRAILQAVFSNSIVAIAAFETAETVGL